MDENPEEGSDLANKKDLTLLKPKNSGRDLSGEVSPHLETEHLELSSQTDQCEVASSSDITQGAGPSNCPPAAGILYDKTPERLIFRTGYARQDKCSRSLSDPVDLETSCRRDTYRSAPSKSERRRKIATVTPPESLFELRIRDVSSEDESDGEKALKEFLEYFPRPCDSPEDSCFHFKKHDSKDHLSGELIDGISCLYVRDASRPPTKDDPSRTYSSEEREPVSDAPANIPPAAFAKKGGVSKFDPETGEKMPVRRELFPKSDCTYSEKEQQSNLDPPNNCFQRSLNLYKRKADELHSSSQCGFLDEGLAGKSQELVPERPTKKGRPSLELKPAETSDTIKSATLAKNNDQFAMKRTTAVILSILSPRESVSPSKRKAEELGINSETSSPEECRKRAKLKSPKDTDDKDNST